MGISTELRSGNYRRRRPAISSPLFLKNRVVPRLSLSLFLRARRRNGVVVNGAAAVGGDPCHKRGYEENCPRQNGRRSELRVRRVRESRHQQVRARRPKKKTITRRRAREHRCRGGISSGGRAGVFQPTRPPSERRRRWRGNDDDVAGVYRCSDPDDAATGGVSTLRAGRRDRRARHTTRTVHSRGFAVVASRARTRRKRRTRARGVKTRYIRLATLRASERANARASVGRHAGVA